MDMEKEELYFEELRHWHTPDSGGVIVTLRSLNRKKEVSIEFERAFSYRCTDEGDLLIGIADGCSLEKISTDDFSVFTAKQSAYLEWFHKQSFDMHKSQNLQHYVIATADEVIDIISAKNPRFHIKQT